nr:hypothetical protein [Halomicroarcula sp. XH51]
MVEYRTQSAIELIVIPTHGRRGLQRTRSSQTPSRPQRRRRSIASRVKSNSVSRRKQSGTTSMHTTSTSRSSVRSVRLISADT